MNTKHIQNMADLRANAPGPAIDLYHGDEVGLVIEALDYAAEDLAFRANYESDGPFPDKETARDYQRSADKYSNLAQTLRKRAGIT